MRFALAAVVSFAFAASATAGVTKLSNVVSDGGAAVSDIVVNDLAIDFTGELGGQQILITLTQGTVYNTAGTGGDTAPNPTFIGIVPELAFDTFVTMGGLNSETSSNTGIFGGAVNLGGAAGANVGTAPDNGISVAFAPNVGVVVPSSDDYLVGRISLSSDAEGTFSYFGSVTTDGDDFRVVDAPIVGGEIQLIPEPTAATLLGLAACGFAAIRKRG